MGALSAAINKLIFLTVLVLIATAGLYFVPQVIESASGPCSALERKTIKANVAKADIATVQVLQRLSDGAYAEEVMKQNKPDLPPAIACAEAYWSGSAPVPNELSNLTRQPNAGGGSTFNDAERKEMERILKNAQ